MTRTCTKCGETKPLDTGFHKHKTGRDGYRSSCKVCATKAARDWNLANAERFKVNKDRHRYKQYGLSESEYAELFAKQNYACAICGTTENTTKKSWHIDHDHKSGRVRGILCHGCNTGLGGFKDNPTSLQKAISYLEEINNG